MKAKILIIAVLMFSVATWAGVKTAPDTGENSKAFVPKSGDITSVKAVEHFDNVNLLYNFQIADNAQFVLVIDEVADVQGYKTAPTKLPIITEENAETYRRARDGVPT